MPTITPSSSTVTMSLSDFGNLNSNSTSGDTPVSTQGTVQTPPTPSTSPDQQLDFLGLQSPEFTAAYTLYQSLLAAATPAPEIITSIAESFQTSWNIPTTPAHKMATLAVKAFSVPGFANHFADAAAISTTASDVPPAPTALTSSSSSPALSINPCALDDYHFTNAFILQSDADAFASFISADPQATLELKTLLLSLLVHYRHNYHPKGWVRYDRRAIMYMAGLSSASPKTQEDLTAHLHTEYGLEMQVIGSNSPIPCFMFPWTKDHPESPSNPVLVLGPYTPKTIINSVAALLSSPASPTV